MSKEGNNALMSHLLSYIWEWVSTGKPLVQARLSQHNVTIKFRCGIVSVLDSICKFSECFCATCSQLQTASSSNSRQKKHNIKKRKEKKRWYEGAGCGEVFILSSWDREARNVWVKTTTFLGLLLMLFLLRCQCVVWSYCQVSLFTAQFLNRWRPVSWWSWEEVEEESCSEEVAEIAANRQNGNMKPRFYKIVLDLKRKISMFYCSHIIFSFTRG